jgi:hypothetical protein
MRLATFLMVSRITKYNEHHRKPGEAMGGHLKNDRLAAKRPDDGGNFATELTACSRRRFLSASVRSPPLRPTKYPGHGRFCVQGGNRGVIAISKSCRCRGRDTIQFLFSIVRSSIRVARRPSTGNRTVNVGGLVILVGLGGISESLICGITLLLRLQEKAVR